MEIDSAIVPSSDLLKVKPEELTGVSWSAFGMQMHLVMNTIGLGIADLIHLDSVRNRNESRLTYKQYRIIPPAWDYSHCTNDRIAVANVALAMVVKPPVFLV